jgi:hypothetical protein
MGEQEQVPSSIPPSFEVIQEQARNAAQEIEGRNSKEHGIGYVLGRVKQGLTDAAKSLIGGESKGSLRGYLSRNDPDHRIVIGYIDQVNKKFAENPDLPRDGWDEIWLPSAVEGQGGNVSRAQADRLIAILAFRNSRQEKSVSDGDVS